ncbi:hypothetical protein E2C01_055737 [Portunus trituberculatus]|uniref:Uncharacterized protein n=1 Tax=Portunus trituberculatus TaxID=210409 RepID=A0A5B7GS27_PORTR|nr:hypothetical protein [Portunus trituberculatus]
MKVNKQIVNSSVGSGRHNTEIPRRRPFPRHCQSVPRAANHQINQSLVGSGGADEQYRNMAISQYGSGRSTANEPHV